jgi:hypothetical protein
MIIADVSRPYRRRRRDWRRERRILVAALGAVMVALALLVFLGNVAYGGSAGGSQTVRVGPGDSVWSIATDRYGDSGDLRSRVDQILSANHIQGGVVVPGQTLLLPPP